MLPSVSSSEDRDSPEPENYNHLDFLSHKGNYQIPTAFQKCAYKRHDEFTCRVTHVYDPSKFYIVSKHIELEAFQTLMFKFYYMNNKNYKIPEEKLEVDQYCVVFSDTAYFRGLIVAFPLTQTKGEHANVFYLDCGFVGAVKLEDIYYMSEDFLKVPQFAIRATAALMTPIGGELWSHVDASMFWELVNYRILTTRVVFIDSDLQIVGIQLQEYCEAGEKVRPPIHEIMLREKRAKYVWESVPDKFRDDKNEFEPKSKFGWMYPSHEALESGHVPLTRQDMVYMESIMPILVFEGPYWKVKAKTVGKKKVLAEKKSGEVTE